MPVSAIGVRACVLSSEDEYEHEQMLEHATSDVIKDTFMLYCDGEYTTIDFMQDLGFIVGEHDPISSAYLIASSDMKSCTDKFSYPDSDKVRALRRWMALKSLGYQTEATFPKSFRELRKQHPEIDYSKLRTDLNADEIKMFAESIGFENVRKMRDLVLKIKNELELEFDEEDVDKEAAWLFFRECIGIPYIRSDIEFESRIRGIIRK